jgi:hypothetical protein
VSSGQDIDADHIVNLNDGGETDIGEDNDADPTGYQPSLTRSKKESGQRSNR